MRQQRMAINCRSRGRDALHGCCVAGGALVGDDLLAVDGPDTGAARDRDRGALPEAELLFQDLDRDLGQLGGQRGGDVAEQAAVAVSEVAADARKDEVADEEETGELAGGGRRLLDFLRR